MVKRRDDPCSIARSLEVLGERWTFLVIREALLGATRFAEFTERLGVATDVLTDRLAKLVDAGVLTRQPYQDRNSRGRFSYHLTEAGLDLRVVLSALQQWGDAHCPRPDGPTILRRTADTGSPVSVGYLDETGRVIPADLVQTVKTPAHPHYVG